MRFPDAEWCFAMVLAMVLAMRVPIHAHRSLAGTRELDAENEDLARQIKVGPYARLKCETALLTK